MGYINGNNPAQPPLFSDVVYDNGRYDGSGDPLPCNVEEAPGNPYTVVYPEGLLPGHPVVVWGNGTSGPLELPSYVDFWYFPDPPEGILYDFQDSTCYYETFLKHLASMGFVVIAPNDGFVGSGDELQAAVDVAVYANNVEGTTENPNPFYQKLDLNSIAAVGHSQGAVGVIEAAVADSRISNVVAISTPDNAYCDSTWAEVLSWITWEFAECDVPAAVSQLDVPTFFLHGENENSESAVTRFLLGDLMAEIADYWFWEQGDPGQAQPFYDLAFWVWNSNNTPTIATNATDTAYFNMTVGPAAKATVLSDSSGDHASHLDNTEATGYITAWLAHMSGNSGYAGVEDAFCGPSPEIAVNSSNMDDVDNWQAKNLPCP